MIPEKLKKGDTIGLISPSDSITKDDLEVINQSTCLMEASGFKVKFAKNALKNTLGYGATAKEKAEDINHMFCDKEVKAIFCISGGFNSNSTFEYLDYDRIKCNPKIICGFSDSTSLLNVIYSKTGLVTFHGPTFKALTSWQTEYGYQEIIKRLVEGGLKIGQEGEEYQIVQEGVARGILVGGNLSLVNEMTAGKYAIDFTDKILFLEELFLETPPALASNYLYHMKQNGVFDKIKGIWIGNYDGSIALEQILLDTLEGEYKFPIIKSNNFGHIDKKTVIPIGTMAKIDTKSQEKIELVENCVK
ncbi:MAG: LD-carboxypeptidase [Clostridia bacterium]|jgi:muramoyltetrapeptide carboxypeptidase|nr:LD-carboxypeptidase [Clostridia bacterium]